MPNWKDVPPPDHKPGVRGFRCTQEQWDAIFPPTTKDAVEIIDRLYPNLECEYCGERAVECECQYNGTDAIDWDDHTIS